MYANFDLIRYNAQKRIGAKFIDLRIINRNKSHHKFCKSSSYSSGYNPYVEKNREPNNKGKGSYNFALADSSNFLRVSDMSAPI